MSDTLEALCSRARARRARWDKIPWSSISIQLEGFSGKTPRFVGIALIDRRLVGYLVSNTPRAFRVEPGVHTLTVYFSKRLVSPDYPQWAAASFQVEVQPGESARFVCGASEEWRRLQPSVKRSSRIMLAGFLAVMAGGWLAFPFLRELVATVTLYLGVGQPCLSLCYLAVGSRFVTLALISILYYFVLIIALMLRIRRINRRRGPQSVHPFHLTRVIDSPGDDKPDY